MTRARPYHCCYAGRKTNRRYALSHDELLAALGGTVCHHEPISGVFAAAIGDHGYLVRSPELAEVLDAAHLIQRLA